MESQKVLQYAPFKSFVNSTFWHKLAEVKLNYDRLSDAPKPISGFYTNRNAQSCLLEVDYTAFSSAAQTPKFDHAAHGILYNKNTIEEFKECDKSALLTAEGKKLLDDFNSERILDDPSLLARFLVLSFADLKSHNYYYWFAFPCPLTPVLAQYVPVCKLKDLEQNEQIVQVLQSIPEQSQNFFIIKGGCKDLEYQDLKLAFSNAEDLKAGNAEAYYFCFADPSEYEQPAWLMRSYAAYIYKQFPNLIGKPLKFLGLRYDQQMRASGSLVWQVVQEAPMCSEPMQFVGWEANRNNKMAPRMVSMRDSMDSVKLAESSVNLNLKLMKWRLVPELNLETIASTKCLLFGAGTLGCAVARNLLSWGFKYITLLDNGKVSYANPVRQCLYTHEDAKAGNNMKSLTAAARLREINPSVVATGHVMQIPMPGHTIGASLYAQTDDELNTIAQLVQNHDVIFLLTDSRESRWLPTLLGAAHNKIVINAALGFDSYLVMRHGSNRTEAMPAPGDGKNMEIDGLKCISGNNLGCYFCNDVTAPGNSLKDRTLDQQCTVTRPGVSNIAASYAVELLVSLLQHPLRELAPAYYANTGITNGRVPEGLLGILPHSIRGMLFNFENILPVTQKFMQCIACSERIQNEYRSQGNEFLFKAFESSKYLEDLTGISEFTELDNEIIDFNDSDLEMSDA